MAKAITLYDTTIGKKVVLALTGLVLYGFVIVHMLGNLQVFMGPEQLNGYAKKLHDLGPLLWVGRIVILSCFVVHVATVLQLGFGLSRDLEDALVDEVLDRVLAGYRA